MTSSYQTRRALMTTLASLPLAGTVGASAAQKDDDKQRQSSALVAYFSRSGNTRVVAGLIQRATGADVFEIRPAIAYPEEYLATVKQAQQERDQKLEPALDARLATIGGYDTIYLGFPIWGETAPPVIRSFLSAHDLSRKTVIPFITHGGYGLGDSGAVLKRHAQKAVFQPGFSMQADQERQTMNRVDDWMRDASIRRQ